MGGVKIKPFEFNPELEKKAITLAQHGAFWAVEANRIYGYAPYTARDGRRGAEVEDVTDWSFKELLHWLGY